MVLTSRGPFMQTDQSIEDVAAIPLEAIAPADPRRFQNETWGPVFARLRREAPVHYTPDSPWGPYWSITRHADIMTVDGDPETYSSELKGITIGDPEPEMRISNFIRSDPPKHGPLRRTFAPVVAPHNLAELESMIRSRAARILDELPVGEAFDWVSTVSVELTTQMLATLFGFPFEERHRLTHWSDVATSTPAVGNDTVSDAQRHASMRECLEVFTQLIAERRKHPIEGRLDFIGMLAHGEATQNLEPLEVLGNVQLLIIGGNDTTRNSISGGVLALNENPDEYRKLRENPALIQSMVPEIIRWQTPLAHMRRTTTCDTVLNGVAIPKDAKLSMWYLSGNRDSTAIERADEFIIDRDRPRQHQSFGFGIHRCMGNRMAEMQLRIVWEEILQRFSMIEVVGPVERVLSNSVRGIASMPVRLTRKS